MRKALASVIILVFASTVCATLFAVLTSAPDGLSWGGSFVVAPYMLY